MSTDPDTSDEEAPRWAADEPTAMWDESMLRDAGFEADAQPSAGSAPATERGVKGDDPNAIHVSPELSGGHRALRPSDPAKPSGASWALTLLLAIGLGVAAFFLVRYLR